MTDFSIHTAMARVIGLALMLTMSACGPADEKHSEPPKGASTDSATTKAGINGSWLVAYQDTQHGFIKGRAFIDSDADYAELLLSHPQTGKQTKLTADSLEIDGAEVTITWVAGEPDNKRTFKPLGEAVPTNGPSVSLGLGETEQEVSLKKPAVPDGKVTVELIFYPDSENLSGEWRQSIDAVSGNAGEGKGRAGYFRYGTADEGGAELSGMEVWRRPIAVIKDTFSINNQFSSDFAGPSYPYPFSEAGGEVSDSSRTRYVFVLGKELPQRRSDNIRIESLDADVDYYLYELKSSYETRGGPGKVDTYWRDQGYKLIDQVTQGELCADGGALGQFKIVEV